MKTAKGTKYHVTRTTRADGVILRRAFLMEHPLTDYVEVVQGYSIEAGQYLYFEQSWRPARWGVGTLAEVADDLAARVESERGAK